MNSAVELGARAAALSAEARASPKTSLDSPARIIQQHGLVVGVAPGHGGVEHPHILTYAPEKIGFMQALVLTRDLTVCKSLWVWARHGLYVIYALVLMLIFGFTAFPDTPYGSLQEDAGPACSPAAPSKNGQTCQLADLLDESVREFRFLIAFVLAGFVAGTVNVWNTRRTNCILAGA